MQEILQTICDYSLLKWANTGKTVYYTLWLIFMGLSVLFSFISGLVLYRVMTIFSIAIHEQMFKSVLLGNRHFYESNQSGRILNRFSKDISIIDDNIPSIIGISFFQIFRALKFAFIPAFFNPYLYIPFAMILCMFILVARMIIPKTKKMEALNKITTSHMYNHFETIIDSITVVRGLNYQNYALNKGFELIDKNIAVCVTGEAILKYAQFQTMILSWILTLIVIITVIYFPFKHNDDFIFIVIGIVYSYYAQDLYQILKELRNISNGLISVQRVWQYCEIDSENIHLDRSLNNIEFNEKYDIKIDNIWCKYRNELNYVLKGISIDIKSGTKVGIVGRTGSGKSTLFLCLMKFIELDKGRIQINNTNINSMDLHELRSLFSVIPQTPIIYSESIKYNIDPFSKYSDNEIYKILKEVQLHHKISKLKYGLDTILSSKYKIDTNIKNDNDIDGFALSFGEAQLLCLARCLLNNKPILLMDEATSNIDIKTDSIIQTLLNKHESLQNKTIITIAHRINTVINYDKIISIKNGNIIEYDSPNNLLKKDPNDKDSVFIRLYNEHTQHMS